MNRVIFSALAALVVVAGIGCSNPCCDPCGGGAPGQRTGILAGMPGVGCMADSCGIAGGDRPLGRLLCPRKHAHMGGPPGPPTGHVGYPYYTTRGPRDFLAANPPSIGP